MKTAALFLAGLALLLGCRMESALAGQAEHVVIVVWDGMRPDFVSEQYTPNLHQLAAKGTFFRNHHCSFISSTEVNGAALTTGVYPRRSGILANVQYRPEFSWLNSYGTESFDVIRRGDLLSDGHYLEVATVPEILQRAGFPTITAGAKPVVLLHDRAPEKTTQAQKDSVTLFRGQSLPRSVARGLVELPQIGPFPTETAAADSTQAKILTYLKKGKEKAYTWLYGKPKEPPLSRLIDAWTTKALIHGLWTNGVPKYTLLWLSEPDASQHASGPGSENAEAGLEESDKNLGLVLKALKEKGVLERTDVLVVSDHGFSTVDRGPDVIKGLKRAKFSVAKQFENPEPGDILAASLGGSTSFYVYNHDEPTIRRLVEFLQTTDYAGVIFSSVPVEGTFPIAQVRLDASKGAPDVLVSMRWTEDRNNFGARGMLTAAEGSRGRGTHASLSRYDLHNTLIASGPDFKTNYVSELPSGNIDVAPTVLSILGIAPPAPMDGRVLMEAFAGSTNVPTASRQVLKASRTLGFRVWQQRLTFSQVGSVVYFEEGIGESSLK